MFLYLVKGEVGVNPTLSRNCVLKIWVSQADLHKASAKFSRKSGCWQFPVTPF